ncbi:MAG: cyclodeaminase/cyclohydrolase family protein [Coriobacteriales bacterium]
MADSVDLSCRDFVSVLASKEPAPGGGGASALVGAVACALGNMVGSLTVGKPRYADVEEELLALNQRSAQLQEQLLALVARDAEVFVPLSAAYGLPKDTEEQRAHKQQVMESCLVACCEVPLQIMDCCVQVIKLCGEYAQKGSRLALSDAGCGAAIAAGALRAASLNVFVNTKLMQDRAKAAELDERADRLLSEGAEQADKVVAEVEAQLKG